MKDRGILFKGDMVLATMDGRKTNTRRIIKPGRGQDWLTQETIASVKRWENTMDDWWSMAVGKSSRIIHCGIEIDGGHIGSIRCPYGVPGDRLWVRETWRLGSCTISGPEIGEQTRPVIQYKCGGFEEVPGDLTMGTIMKDNGKWKSSRFMPRWASRINLEITDIRVERVQDIDDLDAFKEGITHGICTEMGMQEVGPRVEFQKLWDSINVKRGFPWSSNCYVWVISFKKLEAK